ncbi:hypothetical protein OG601_08565 [Streptomyces sp. NBC_01239]|uniref:hypothetical protein n=1 Tax=Streptomyces sp. NBC_01239 TaxID=2903792 RepID=UPI00225B6269|nr:hypothetical protein [Streptomyces sp. NBC_01239]MCX4810673.1 hypothetical protein [Streptomyces sp. NBC_01239]
METGAFSETSPDQGHALTDLLGVNMYPSDAAVLALELSKIDDLGVDDLAL